MKFSTKRVVLIGAGGAGVSGLAWLFRELGLAPLLCRDLTENQLTQNLARAGVAVAIGDGDLEPAVGDFVIFSSAAAGSADLKKIEEFAAENPGATRRFEYFSFLGEISKFFVTRGIAGTHGKSTSTAMAVVAARHLLGNFGLGIVGAVVPDLELELDDDGNPRENSAEFENSAGGNSEKNVEDFRGENWENSEKRKIPRNFAVSEQNFAEIRQIFAGILEIEKMPVALVKKFLFVVEACEYRGQFLRLNLDFATVTNLSLDHRDFYADFEKYLENFLWLGLRTKSEIFAGDAAVAEKMLDAAAIQKIFGKFAENKNCEKMGGEILGENGENRVGEKILENSGFFAGDLADEKNAENFGGENCEKIDGHFSGEKSAGKSNETVDENSGENFGGENWEKIWKNAGGNLGAEIFAEKIAEKSGEFLGGNVGQNAAEILENVRGKISVAERGNLEFEKMFGAHNLANGRGVARGLRRISEFFGEKIAAEEIAAELGEFGGLRRRLELLGETKNGAKFFSDYAHHPEAVASVGAALRAEFPEKKIFLVLQPHQVSRVVEGWEEFVDALGFVGASGGAGVGREIYAAREPRQEIRDPRVVGKSLGEISQHFAEAAGLKFGENLDELVAEIAEKNADRVVVLMTAGDLDFALRQRADEFLG